MNSKYIVKGGNIEITKDEWVNGIRRQTMDESRAKNTTNEK
jgi:hypothetical protein